MFCYHGTATNQNGDALRGYFVECVVGSTVQAIYSDNASTPIQGSSGVANRAKTDDRGNYFFFVSDGLYDQNYYNTEGTFQFSQTNFSMVGTDSLTAATNASNLTSGTVPAARMPALTGDVTSTVGTVATTIAAGAVTLAKQANMATASVVYRKTAASGPPEVQTLATLKTDLGLTGTNSGDQTITLTGDATGSGTGSFAVTIATVTSGTKGLAPASGGGTTNFLRADGTWAAPAGGGGTTTNALTINNGGAGVASGGTFNGAAAITISYNSIGAAPLASPTFTGTPAAPTASYGTATTQLATTAFADALRDIPPNSQTASYTLALTDRAKYISITTGGVIVPANASVAFGIGATVSIYNDSGSNQTISITSDTMKLAGTATTGSRTLAQNGLATLLKVAATTWVISGAGVT